jgi:hypothetical protein
MKSIKFKHSNIVFAENQDEYKSLPALKIEGPEGHVVTCHKLSFLERLRVLFTGVVWLDMLTFNKPLTPIYMSTKRTDVFIHTDDEKRWFDKLKLDLHHKI